jgi:hypothetical protein
MAGIKDTSASSAAAFAGNDSDTCAMRAAYYGKCGCVSAEMYCNTIRSSHL